MNRVFLTILIFCLSVPFLQAQDGSLFIIGGGKRPPALVQSMIDLAGVKQVGDIVILPMASSEPDTSAFYAAQQFIDQGIPKERIHALLGPPQHWRAESFSKIKSARLIYISGGSQVRFMEAIDGTPIKKIIQKAYQKGAMVAGTSAGAAVMSEKMITGDEFKHPEYTGEFRTIEAENFEIAEGLGLMPEAIIDQHFVYRMRMNRLMTVSLEHPGLYAIGIDESTAIHFRKDLIEVYGNSQVIVLLNEAEPNIKEGLLGGIGLQLHVLLPADRFSLIKD